MLFNALSNAGYCVSLCGPGAELEGVFKRQSPGPARLAPKSGPAQLKHPLENADASQRKISVLALVEHNRGNVFQVVSGRATLSQTL